jgi:hypothetical protein
MEMMGMSSRALSLATVVLLIGFGATDAVLAQATNLEAGKAPSQLFAQTCNACHKSPRGLLKTVAPGSLPGFLRQHYTTSSDMAGVLSAYLVSNGATDTRYQAKDGKDGKDKKDGAREKEANTTPAQPPEHQGRRSRSQDAAKPEGEAAAPAAEGARQKRAARPTEEGGKPEGQVAPEGRKGKRRAKPKKLRRSMPPRPPARTRRPSRSRSPNPTAPRSSPAATRPSPKVPRSSRAAATLRHCGPIRSRR